MTTQQQQQLQASLLSAFDEAGLRQLCRIGLDIDLDQISTGNLGQRVASLVEYAGRQGLTAPLLAASIRQNPGNEQLQALVAAALSGVYGEKKNRESVMSNAIEDSTGSYTLLRLEAKIDRMLERQEGVVAEQADLRRRMNAIEICVGAAKQAPTIDRIMVLLLTLFVVGLLVYNIMVAQ